MFARAFITIQAAVEREVRCRASRVTEIRFHFASTLTNDEREKAVHGFIKELSAVRCDQIVAIAVASDQGVD